MVNGVLHEIRIECVGFVRRDENMVVDLAV